MDHYLEIKLLSDPEFAPTVLMNALFAKLHRRLVDLQSTGIGVSFPDLKHESKPVGLGHRLRLHGSAEDLQKLMDLPWLSGMHDHTVISELASVSAQAGACTVRRVQPPNSVSRRRNRLMRKEGIDVDTARQRIPDAPDVRLDLPFVTVKSRSTEQTFRLFIQHQPVDRPVPGAFNCYGLSTDGTATVPWF